MRNCTGGVRDSLPGAARVGRFRGLRRDLHRRQRHLERRFGVPERHPILRPLGTREARLDRVETEFNRVGIDGVRSSVHMEQTLRTRVRIDQLHARLVAAREAQVIERHLIDREYRDRGAVLGTHVPKRGAVRDRQVLESLAEELHELADDAGLPQQLRNREHEIGRGRAFRQRAGQTDAQDLRDQHRARLTEHRGLRLDAADAPAEDAQSVDHRRMRVGAEERVGVRDGLPVDLLRENHAGKMLDVDLVHDARVRRDDLEIAERPLAPAEKGITLAVARELELRVEGKGVGATEIVDLHRMIDHEFDGLQRIDAVRVAVERDHRVAHRGQVDHARHAGEVLEQHARGHEGDFLLEVRRRVPLRYRLDVGGLHEGAIFAPQQVLEQDLHRVGQPRDAAEPRLLERGKAVDLNCLSASADLGARIETVSYGHTNPELYLHEKKTMTD